MMRTVLVLVLAVAGALAVSVVGSSGCSIDHRSDTFTTCETQAQCAPNERCTNGLCQTGTNPTDGPVPPDGPQPPDAFVCPSQCTSCKLETKTCKVDCGASPATCNVPINCPEGFNCEIVCSTDNGCQTVNCTNSASCIVDCKGQSTCRNLMCGQGPCDVTCDGAGSCRGVDCHGSCQCDLACNALTSCNNFTCPGDLGQCNTIGVKGCNSERTGCNTCP